MHKAQDVWQEPAYVLANHAGEARQLFKHVFTQGIIANPHHIEQDGQNLYGGMASQ
jgi:hypothetical protein